MPGLIQQFPHCDSAVLHEPGKCSYCDSHPEWQELRRAWGINFTGGTDPEKAPCPSERRRTETQINRWSGNRPTRLPQPRTVYEHLEENARED